MSTRTSNPKHDQKRQEWIHKQRQLKNGLVTTDKFDFQLPTLQQIEAARASKDTNHSFIRLVGGVDVSFVKNTDKVVACLVVVDIVTMEVVFEEFEEGVVTEPYIPGFLAFREVPILSRLIRRVRNHPLFPSVILVDGNGTLHYRGFGLACHLGVVCDVPTVGVAKTLLVLDGIDGDGFLVECSHKVNKFGATLPIVGKSGQTHGMAMCLNSDDPQTVFVSGGHRVSLATAMHLCILSAYHGSSFLPEPTNQADLRSRMFISRTSASSASRAQVSRHEPKTWKCPDCSAVNPRTMPVCSFCVHQHVETNKRQRS